MCKGVPGCIEGFPGHYGMFRGVPGVFWGVPRVFRGCSGVFRGVPGVFRGVPGVFRVCSGVFRDVPGCSGFYRHPTLSTQLSAKHVCGWFRYCFQHFSSSVNYLPSLNTIYWDYQRFLHCIILGIVYFN